MKNLKLIVLFTVLYNFGYSQTTTTPLPFTIPVTRSFVPGCVLNDTANMLSPYGRKHRVDTTKGLVRYYSDDTINFHVCFDRCITIDSIESTWGSIPGPQAEWGGSLISAMGYLGWTDHLIKKQVIIIRDAERIKLDENKWYEFVPETKFQKIHEKPTQPTLLRALYPLPLPITTLPTTNTSKW